jgi:hypothetical protein
MQRVSTPLAAGHGTSGTALNQAASLFRAAGRHERVLVTGDPFERDGRWWRPAHWHAERDENGVLTAWLVCSEQR